MFNKFKYKYGGYTLKDLTFDRPNEIIDGRNKELSGNELEMLDCLVSGNSVLGEDYPKFYAVFKGADDTGVRFKWKYEYRNLCAGGRPLAYDSINRKEFDTSYSPIQMHSLDDFSASLFPLNSKKWRPFSYTIDFVYALELTNSPLEVERLVSRHFLDKSELARPYRNMSVKELVDFLKALPRKVKKSPFVSHYYEMFDDFAEMNVRVYNGTYTYESEKNKPHMKGVDQSEWDSLVQEVYHALWLKQNKYEFGYALERIEELEVG